MMEHLSNIHLLILALRDWILPVQHTSSLVFRKLAMILIRNGTIHD